MSSFVAIISSSNIVKIQPAYDDKSGQGRTKARSIFNAPWAGRTSRMYACIDLGSNSFHLLIAEWHEGAIQLIERCSEKVQLGEDVLRSGQISPVAFERGLDCLQSFRQLIELHHVERYWALGTNTFRIAENSDEFVLAANDLGIEISVISGVQEAVLIYAGVISILEETDDERMVIDIGGGSTEIVVGKQHKRLITHSLPVGCVGWRDTYFKSSPQCFADLSESLDEATDAARDIFSGIAPGVNVYNWKNVYASSGTAKLLSTICEEQGLSQGGLTYSALQQLRELMIRTIAEDRELPGLKDRRRELLLPGFAVMSGLMQAFECESIIFSPSALREGMLDFMVHNSKTAENLANDNLPNVSYAGSKY